MAVELDQTVTHHSEFLSSEKEEASAAATQAELLATRRMLLKFDLVLLPCVTLLYLVSFIDRTNIGNAKVAGIEAELGLVGYQFNIALTVFFIAYAVIEVPANIVLKRVGPRIWLSGLTVIFGIISLSTAFITNFGGLVTMRVLLGIAEGGILPGIAYTLSHFYRHDELYFRIGFFFSAASISGAFGGLLAFGLVQIQPIGMLHTWRHIFFFEGIITIATGIIVGYFLPDSPIKFKWLTEDEKVLALSRHREVEMRILEPTRITKRDVKDGFGNIFAIVAALGMGCVNCSVQSLALFMPTIINQLGYTALLANLFTVPPYVVASVLCIALAWFSDRVKRRGVILLCIVPLAIIGFSMQYAIVGLPGVRYFGIFLATCGSFPAAPGFLTWGTNNTTGRAQTAITTAWIVGIGTYGAILAAWTYLPKDAPRYLPGHAVNIGVASAAFTIVLGLVIYVRWENKQRAAGKRDHRLASVPAGHEAILGRKHPLFRYIE